MSKRQRRVALLSCLLGSICLLAVLIHHELTNSSTSPALEAELAEPAAVEPLPPEPALSLPALGLFSAVVERPVFSPTRRPEEAPPPSTPDAEPVQKHPEFSLAGIVVSERGRFVLAVQHSGEGGVVRVGEGRSIDGWTVARIEPDRAVFRRGEAENVMVLEFFDRSEDPPDRPRQVARPKRSRR